MKLFGKCFHEWQEVHLRHDTTFLGKPITEIVAKYRVCKDCKKAQNTLMGSGIVFDLNEPAGEIIYGYAIDPNAKIKDGIIILNEKDFRHE